MLVLFIGKFGLKGEVLFHHLLDLVFGLLHPTLSNKLECLSGHTHGRFDANLDHRPQAGWFSFLHQHAILEFFFTIEIYRFSNFIRALQIQADHLIVIHHFGKYLGALFFILRTSLSELNFVLAGNVFHGWRANLGLTL